MKTRTKVFMSIISIMLSAVLLFVTVVTINNTKKMVAVNAKSRTIELSELSVDTQSVFDEYDEASFDVNGMVATFTGYQTLDASILSNIDEISQSDAEILDSCKVRYEYTYNAETNIVTLFAEMQNEYGEIIMDELYGLAFLNENGEVDAVINLEDGDNILISDLINQGALDNVGWLSRLFKSVVVAVVTVAAVAITVVTAGTGAVATVAAATAILTSTAYDTYEQTQAYINYQNNKKLDSTVTGLVNGQGYYSNWKFGVRTFDYNGCGVIATYNVMYLLNKKQKLSQVAYDIERKQGTLVWGFAGTDPTHPYEYFKEKGIPVKQYYSQSSFNTVFNNMKTSQYALVCFWNNKNDITKGAHFVAVSKTSSGDYIVYNYSSSERKAEKRSDLADVMNEGKGSLICGLIIN